MTDFLCGVCQKDVTQSVVDGATDTSATVAMLPATGSSKRVLRIWCPDGHACDYHWPDRAGESSQDGMPVSAGQVEEWQSMRQYLHPVQGRARQDAFAMWLFGASTSIATVSGLLTSTTIVPTVGGGMRWAMMLAVACMSASMACAAWALTPQAAEYAPSAPGEMRKLISSGVASRQGSILGGAVLLAVGLVLLALAGFLAADSN